MTTSQYRFLLWQFITASDSGKYDSVTVEEVVNHAQAGTIQAFLIDRFGSDLDFSLLKPQDWSVVSETWADIANAVNASRKFGVENRSVSLLMAYTLESLKARAKLLSDKEQFHVLEHSIATHLLDAGADLRLSSIGLASPTLGARGLGSERKFTAPLTR